MLPAYAAIPLTFAVIVAEYLFCGVIDYLRILLFKVLRIKKLCVFIEKKCRILISKIFKLESVKIEAAQEGVLDSSQEVSEEISTNNDGNLQN